MFKFTFRASRINFRADVARTAGPILMDVLRRVRDEMRRRFTLPKSGKPGPFTRRSAKGEAPARQTGRLYNSIPVVQVTDFKAELTVNAPYAGYLENNLGRPFALVSVQSVVEQFRANRIGF